MKFNKFLLRILCVVLILTVACGVAAKLHVDNKAYKVEFDANGGTGVEAQYVVKGELVTAPADPTREGYTFVGWFYHENEFNFETPVKGAMTLVAHWEKLPAECPHADKNDDNKCDNCGADFEDGNDTPALTTYSITYVDGAEKLDLAPKSFNAASTGLKLPTPAAKAHYEFAGWYLDAEFTTLASEINVNANAPLTFYALYTPVTYKVTYELDNGVNSENNVATYTVEDLPVLFENATKEGYEFKGWFTDANCTVAFEGLTAENAGNLTLFAKWEKILVPHTVTYLDHNRNVIGSDIFYESGEDQPLRASYELDGYIFRGWVNPRQPMIVYTCIPAGTAEDITVMANMEKVDVYHKVNYFINGVEHSSVNFKEEEGLAELLAYSKVGYEFDGWYNELDDKVTSIPANTTEDVNLYATLTVITYTVHYYDCDTQLNFELASYTVSDTDIALPALPEKVGVVAIGWYTTFDFSGDKLTVIAAGTTGDLVLYAKYDSLKYTVTYNTNGAENDPRNIAEYTHGNIPTLYAPQNRDGYVFGGWYTNGEFSGDAVESLHEFANQDVTLYAKWIEIVDDGGTTTPEVPLG